MKKLLCVLLIPPLLCGCEREVSPVSALALDRQGSGYRLTAEVVRQDSLDDPAAPAYFSATGSDLPELLQKVEYMLSSELYLDQTQVLLLSENVAKDSILALADYLCQKPDIRLSLRIAVVRDGSASDVLKADDEVFALSDMLDRAADAGVLPDMPLYRATEVLHTDGTAILPAVRVDEFEQTTPAGTAVFANARLSCFLDGEIGGGSAEEPTSSSAGDDEELSEDDAEKSDKQDGDDNSDDDGAKGGDDNA